ncbi:MULTISPECIES: hypothetical protein [Cyanophyceae]|nr:MULTISPECIES: hypothetical protein [unclassified Trichocoleus]
MTVSISHLEINLLVIAYPHKDAIAFWGEVTPRCDRTRGKWAVF